MRDKILEAVNTQQNLPPLPDILIKLEGIIDDPDSCIADISGLIKTEPVLSGRLMKLANSVFIGGGRDKAEDLDNALGRLGLKMVLDLAYTLEIPKVSSKTKSINQVSFWKHSFATAVCSKSLSEFFEQNDESRENAYLAGLMHDIGILVFLNFFPKEYSEFLVKMNDADQPLDVLEVESFGIDHAEVGAKYIEKWWPIAPGVISLVQEHHRPLKKGSQDVVALSNVLLNHQKVSNGVGPKCSEEEPDFAPILGISEEKMNAIKEEIENSLEQVSSIFEK
jgi:HD-like signal output (HDOD) protein